MRVANWVELLGRAFSWAEPLDADPDRHFGGMSRSDGRSVQRSSSGERNDDAIGTAEVP